MAEDSLGPLRTADPSNPTHPPNVPLPEHLTT